MHNEKPSVSGRLNEHDDIMKASWRDVLSLAMRLFYHTAYIKSVLYDPNSALFSGCRLIFFIYVANIHLNVPIALITT